MHKIRNTKHKEALESLYGIIPPGHAKPLSKAKLRYLLVRHNWEPWTVKDLIEKDEWWYPFCID
jgi:hypothetical protein